MCVYIEIFKYRLMFLKKIFYIVNILKVQSNLADTLDFAVNPWSVWLVRVFQMKTELSPPLIVEVIILLMDS